MAPNLSFQFKKYKDLHIDLDTLSINYLFNQIECKPDTYFNFRINKGDAFAYGEGATRHVHHQLCNELTEGTDPLMVKVGTYFMDINKSNKFWQLENNIRCFVTFISMVARAGYTLPYHFTPGLLEAINGVELNMSELKFFMKLIDPELLATADKLTPDEFDLLGSDYANHAELYRSKVIGDIDNDTKLIYMLIAEEFEQFVSFDKYGVINIDRVFSGNYHITPDNVIAITNIKSEYYDRWCQFLRSLDESELKRMLILIRNTVSMRLNYHVRVVEETKIDVNISTCYREIYINKKFFDNDKQMQMLKIYFCDTNDVMEDDDY